MKAIFRCKYCDKMGVEEEISKHESECIHNYTKKSCFTCKHRDKASGISISCKQYKVAPKGKYFEHCELYEWDEIDYT